MHAARDEVASPGPGTGMGTRRLVANFNKRLQMINVNKAQTQLRQPAAAVSVLLQRYGLDRHLGREPALTEKERIEDSDSRSSHRLILGSSCGRNDGSIGVRLG